MLEKKITQSYLKKIIKEKSCYKNSSISVKKIVEQLDNSYDGYLTQLVNLPDFSDKKSIWKIEYISLGVNKILTGITLKSEINNEESLVEFASTKEGNNPFSFGVLGISKGDKITHIGFINKQTYLSNIPDLHPVMAYFPNFSNTSVFSIPENIKRELNKVTEKNTEISRFVDLGSVIPDISMSWNKVSLFLAIVITEVELKNDSKIVNFVPIEEIKAKINTITDGQLLSIIAKLVASDII
jgi:hypothetical protein